MSSVSPSGLLLDHLLDQAAVVDLPQPGRPRYAGTSAAGVRFALATVGEQSTVP